MRIPNFHTLPPRLRLAIGASSLVAVLIGLASVSQVLAHGEQIEVGGGIRGPVHLSPTQQQTLELKLAAAALRPLPELFYLNGEVGVPADRQAEASTRISGQVTALYAHPGDTVKAGQRLARVQSRLIGNPPPSVEIAAPMGGVIDAVAVSLGQAVEPATALVSISDRSQVDIVARVYEEDLGKVRIGQDAQVRTLSYPERVFTGRIDQVGATLDPQSRTVNVRIRLANADGALKPNMFARAGIVLRENAAVLTVPAAAIIEANGEKFVFVRQKGDYERVDVHTGSSDGQFTEVTEGLVPGDEVVTQGNREIYTLWLTGGALKEEDD